MPTTTPPAGFDVHELSPKGVVFVGRLPETLGFSTDRFEELWAMHPPKQPEVVFANGPRIAPRWHQAYGKDYEFAGTVSQASPVPPILQPMLAWVQEAIEPRTNGILVNWYDGQWQHHISQHKDSPIDRIPGAPIVTVSLGAARTFQMFVRRRPVPFRVGDGDVIVIPDETNRHHAHSVPHLDGDQGRRISVTLRSFT